MASSIRTAFILIAASRARATRRYAYATLLAGSDAYLPGAETLVCSLAAAARRAERAHAAWAAVGAPDFLALTTPEVDAAAVEARLGAARAASGFEGALVVRPVALIAGPTFDGSERFRHTYAKLHVFNQTAYARIVFVDADAFVLRDVAALFLLGDAWWLAAAPDHGMKLQRDPARRFNTGVVSARPDATRFATLVRRLAAHDLRKTGGGRAEGSDQGFLQAYVAEDPAGFLLLPHSYNVLKRREKSLKDKFRLEDAFVVHLVGGKPWEPGDPGSVEYPVTHGAWHAARKRCGLGAVGGLTAT